MIQRFYIFLFGIFGFIPISNSQNFIYSNLDFYIQQRVYNNLENVIEDLSRKGYDLVNITEAYQDGDTFNGEMWNFEKKIKGKSANWLSIGFIKRDKGMFPFRGKPTKYIWFQFYENLNYLLSDGEAAYRFSQLEKQINESYKVCTYSKKDYSMQGYDKKISHRFDLYLDHFDCPIYNKDDLLPTRFELNYSKRMFSLKEATFMTDIEYLITSNGTKRIQLSKKGRLKIVDVNLNGAIEIPFIVDTGASMVYLSKDVFNTLKLMGSVLENDFKAESTFSYADGSTDICKIYILKSVSIGDIVIKNVEAAISNNNIDDMLLGQSFLDRLGEYKINNELNQIIIE